MTMKIDVIRGIKSKETEASLDKVRGKVIPGLDYLSIMP
jgi:hypothetical protein